MEPIITVNQYPIGWEWLDRVPLEDFNWLIEIFSTMTDNTDTYDFVGYTDSETLPGHQKICSVDKIPLANFLNDDQYYDYNVDELDMVLYGATIILEQEKYKPLILQKLQDYQDNFDEEKHAEIIDYYINFLEKPETLYTFTEKIISLLKSFIK